MSLTVGQQALARLRAMATDVPSSLQEVKDMMAEAETIVKTANQRQEDSTNNDVSAAYAEVVRMLVVQSRKLTPRPSRAK